MKLSKKPVKNNRAITNESQLRSQIERTTKTPIVGAELIHPKDSLHYLRGALDQITCKIAAKKSNTVGFSFKTLKQTADPIKQAKILGRMQQNMQLCQKFKVKTKILSCNSTSLETAFIKYLQNKK